METFPDDFDDLDVAGSVAPRNSASGMKSLKSVPTRQTSGDGAVKGLHKALQEAENEIQKLRHNNQNLIVENNRYRADNQRLTMLEAKTEARLHILSKELSACKDDLFQLQPMNQPSDTSIKNQYEAVCQEILDWIEEEITVFETLGKETSTQMFSGGGNPQAAYMLYSHPEIGEYLIRYEIHRYLQREMFHKDIYLLGLPQDIVRLLQMIERSLVNMKPSKRNKPYRFDFSGCTQLTLPLSRDGNLAFRDIECPLNR